MDTSSHKYRKIISTIALSTVITGAAYYLTRRDVNRITDANTRSSSVRRLQDEDFFPDLPENSKLNFDIEPISEELPHDTTVDVPPSLETASQSEFHHPELQNAGAQARSHHTSQLPQYFDTTTSATTPTIPNSHSTWPDIAWLMAFPESGMGYITRVIHHVSETSMATNYGPELGQNYETIPDVERTPSGPYRYNDSPFPSRYILTKTYCAGFCLGCESMFVSSPEVFYRSCALGSRVLNGVKPSTVQYNEVDGKKAVHLFRNPFDNVVLRFYSEYRRFKDHLKDYGRTHHQWNYPFNQHGFGRWCNDLDIAARKADNRLRIGRIENLVKDVPCYGQFYQYAEWHNRAFDATKTFRIPSLVVHYDDFRDNVEESIDALFNFLELPLVGAIPRFQFERFPEFYTKTQRVAISSLLKVLCSSPTWVEVKRYLPPPEEESHYRYMGLKLSPYYGEWPEIAWLLAYPNSGTHFTTQLLEVGSQTTTATNYLPETKGSYLDLPNYAYSEEGPFRASARLFPSKYILTRTHCAGHSYESNPDNVLTTHLEFMKGCGTGVGIAEDGSRKSTRYKATDVAKLVHLIRNPFDNVVARFHYLYERYNTDTNAVWNYNHNALGFKEYCEDLDTEFEGMRISTFGADASLVARQIPCHGEFYQYIQWHNNAFRLPDLLKKPQILMMYEDYERNIDASVERLFDFLELELTNFVTPFQWVGGFRQYFTDEERDNIKKFINMLCTGQTCDIMNYYFEQMEIEAGGETDTGE